MLSEIKLKEIKDKTAIVEDLSPAEEIFENTANNIAITFDQFTGFVILNFNGMKGY